MHFRAPGLDDAPAVLAVLEARDRADIGVVDYTLGDLLDEWRGGDFDLTADAIVAESEEGKIVAYGVVQRPGSRAVVHPAHEGQGIGTELLRWVQERERSLGRPCHRQWTVAGNGRAEALLRAAGYRTVRSYWRMVRALEGADERPVSVPDGIALRPLDVGRDGVAVHALDRASFAANPDYQPESLEEFRHEHLEAHNLDPELSCVAERSGRLIGVLLARRWTAESIGFIDILAVHPDAQRRGLGTALLMHAFRRFGEAGLREAQLGVASDNPRALALYELVGMTPRFRADVYERSLNRRAEGG